MLLLFLVSYLLVGGDIVWSALKNVVRGRVFDEFFLMSLATAGALAVGAYPEAVAVMLFFKIGELFQETAVSRSRASIRSVLALRPDFARVIEGGESRLSDPGGVRPGAHILVRPGERVPLDGQIRAGTSAVDASALTGEARPRLLGPGEAVLSGMVNQTAALTVRVDKALQESTVSRILELVERAAERKAPTEQFITKFARIYTPAVVLAALLIAFGPPLLAALPGLEALFAAPPSLEDWIYRGLIFLVISCPCALVVSIPLGFFGGIGAASRRGVLVKGAHFLEGLSSLAAVVWDKTGTLTRGGFTVQRVLPGTGFGGEEVLNLAAAAESHSNHPLARAIREAGQWLAEGFEVREAEEAAGQGVQALVGGRRVLVGNAELMRAHGIEVPQSEGGPPAVTVAVDGRYAGRIEVSDELKPGAQQAVRALQELGVRRQYLLSGDVEEAAFGVAEQLGLDGYHAAQLPQDKVARMEEIASSHRGDGLTAFVGDGINDAPVLARADIGVAMGGLGSDAAIEAADVVLMEGSPGALATACAVARRTRAVVWQNIVLALGVKGLVLALGALGQTGMWEAVFADVGVALLAILNAVRILR